MPYGCYIFAKWGSKSLIPTWCTLFSVGSDGHYLGHFRFHFDDLFALLKAKGVTELAIYQIRKANYGSITGLKKRPQHQK